MEQRPNNRRGQPNSSRLRSPKRSELVADQIGRQILDGRLSVGSRLAPEGEMASELGVGRNTLREALRLLEFQGLLSIRAGRDGGPIVTRPQRQQLAQSLALLLQLEHATLGQVADVRAILEPIAARMAASELSDEQLDRLDETITAIEDHPDDDDLFEEQNRLFHGLIAEGSGSPVICVFIESVKALSEGKALGVRYDREVRLNVARAHRRVVTALRNRDPEGAEEAMRGHLSEFQRFIRRRFPSLSTHPVSWTLNGG